MRLAADVGIELTKPIPVMNYVLKSASKSARISLDIQPLLIYHLVFLN